MTSVLTVQHLLRISRMQHLCSFCELFLASNHTISVPAVKHLTFPLYYYQNSNLKLWPMKSHCPPHRSSFSKVISRNFPCMRHLNKRTGKLECRLFNPGPLFNILKNILWFGFVLVGQRSYFEIYFQFNNFVKLFSLCVIWFILNILWY